MAAATWTRGARVPFHSSRGVGAHGAELVAVAPLEVAVEAPWRRSSEQVGVAACMRRLRGGLVMVVTKKFGRKSKEERPPATKTGATVELLRYQKNGEEGGGVALIRGGDQGRGSRLPARVACSRVCRLT
jgi:hypothetical protein